MKKSKNSSLPSAKKPISVPILADLTHRGDDTYVLKPKAIKCDLDSWVPVTNASKILGLNRRSIYNLIDPERALLVHRRILQRKTLISLKSIQSFLRATSDPDFWSDMPQRKRLQAEVRKELAEMEPLS